MNKILVGVPCYSEKDYCWEAFKENLSKLKGPEMDFLFIDSSRMDKPLELGAAYSSERWTMKRLYTVFDGRNTLTMAQNIIRDHFLEGDYTHLLFVEQDIFPEEFDLLELLAENKPVVGRPYYKYSSFHKHDYIVWTEAVELPDGSLDAQIIPLIDVFHKLDGKCRLVFNIGVGFCLIKRHVMEEVLFRVEPNEEVHSDTYFAQDLFMNGIPFWAKTKLIKHIDTEFINK